MDKYVYGKLNLIHIINLKETVKGLLRASDFLAKAVGRSEEILFVGTKKQGMEIEIGIFPYSINGLAACRNEVDGAVKIVSDAKYGEMLGVHIVGGGATELVGEAVLAMQLECTAREFARSIRIHPTFSEAVVDAARDAEKWALYLPRK